MYAFSDVYANTGVAVTVPGAECLNLKVNIRISFMWPGGIR